MRNYLQFLEKSENLQIKKKRERERVFTKIKNKIQETMTKKRERQLTEQTRQNSN